MGNARILAFYITVCFLAFIIAKIVIACLLYQRWSRKRKVFRDSLSGGKMVVFKSPAIRSLTKETFLKNTMKLTNKDIIGSGGYGTVYRMRINDSLSFAVKKLNKGRADGDCGFERELNALGDIKHRNIVPLRGYYTAPHFNLLIYDLMPNGSLDTYLHGKSTEKTLDWPSRYKIAVGAARGISYLHHDCIPNIIHRDIKSSNILLDRNMEAKVSDFGLATLMDPDQTHVSTFVAGTFGYLAPEYFDTGRATAKGDVYSFGVVLLELLTSKRPTDETFIETGSKLVTWVKAVVDNKREEHAIDMNLGSCPVHELKNIFHIAMNCLESEPSKRPTMAEVLKMLEQIKSEKDESDDDHAQMDGRIGKMLLLMSNIDICNGRLRIALQLRFTRRKKGPKGGWLGSFLMQVPTHVHALCLLSSALKGQQPSPALLHCHHSPVFSEEPEVLTKGKEMAADRRNGKELLTLEAAEGRKDYISTLPTELLSSILSLIPIKEAVRTSILSKKWIDIWTEMPVLKLDPHFGNDPYSNSQGVYYFNADDEFFSVLEWLNNVQRILCSRRNPIPKCYFWHDLCDAPILVNQTIAQLMEVGVHELKLTNSSDKRFALTPSVFKSPFLKFLSVRCCRLKFPSSFKLVETNLISITFQQTLLTDDTIYRLVSACKFLENFELRHCKGFQNVKINAPNLRCFMITSHLPVSICLEYVPQLEEVFILFIAHRRSMPWRSKRTSFMAFLWSLVGVENLSMELTPKVAQGLLEGIAWEQIHIPLHNLKQLQLGISLANMNQVLFLAFMLRNSGYLEEIKIWVKRSDILGSPSKLDYWETHESFQCLTHYVKNIQIDEVNLDNEYDIEFLKYLIMNTPVLERMSVSYYGSWRSRVFVAEELQKLKMASPNAHLDMSQSRRWNIG